jgi:predicted dehydrogenase
MKRRGFLKASFGAAMGAGLGIADGAGSSKPSPPSDTVVLGFIGLGGRGVSLMDSFMGHPDVRVGAVCDVYRPRVEKALSKTNGKAKGYKDFRELLDQKDIDAVVIATPPHWHALMTIYACQAGKDVYVEKPISLYLGEGWAMAKAAKDNKRVVQVGTQIHAGENYHRVVEIIRSGILGKITIVRNILAMNDAPNGIGFQENKEPPEDLDWDMWLGPAQELPFNPAVFGNYRYFSQFIGSWLLEMGPHIIDLPYWALDLPDPIHVTALGGKYAIKDMSDIPDTMEVVYEYPNGLLMTWTQTSANSYGFEFQGAPGIRLRLGVIFQGTNGTLAADYESYKLIPEGNRIEGFQPPEPYLKRSPGHEREFLNCIKTREEPSCNLEYHCRVHTALCLGQLALKVGRRLRWDGRTRSVIGDIGATAFLWPRYRSPWKLQGL